MLEMVSSASAGSCESARAVPSVGVRRSYSPLKYQRLLCGWSQRDVADELYKRCADAGAADVGITVDMVGKWERGERKPAPMYRKHLCTLFGLTAEQFGWM